MLDSILNNCGRRSEGRRASPARRHPRCGAVHTMMLLTAHSDPLRPRTPKACASPKCSAQLTAAVEQALVWTQLVAEVCVRETDSAEETRDMIRMFTKVLASAHAMHLTVARPLARRHIASKPARATSTSSPRPAARRRRLTTAASAWPASGSSSCSSSCCSRSPRPWPLRVGFRRRSP